jgi:hypothetical protein
VVLWQQISFEFHDDVSLQEVQTDQPLGGWGRKGALSFVLWGVQRRTGSVTRHVRPQWVYRPQTFLKPSVFNTHHQEYHSEIVNSNLRVCYAFEMDLRIKQGRRCTYNVTLRRVRATIVAVGKQWVLLFRDCVCRLSYPVCNVYTPHCHMWTSPFYNILPRYLMNGRFSGGGGMNTNGGFYTLYRIYLKRFSV